MTAGSGQDEVEIEALITDRYLESLLADALPRFHPSFRFEEALSARLTAAALARRLPAAAGSEGILVPFAGGDAAALDEDPGLAAYLRGEPTVDSLGRPLLIGGALTSAALSLAGAAIVAWRWRRPPRSPMSRAVRAVARTRPS